MIVISNIYGHFEDKTEGGGSLHRHPGVG